MDWAFLRIAGLIVLGWTLLSFVVAAGMSLFLRRAHRLESPTPAEPAVARTGSSKGINPAA